MESVVSLPNLLSACQVSGKSVILLTNRQTSADENITSMVEVIILEEIVGEMLEIQHLKLQKFVFHYAIGVLMDCANRFKFVQDSISHANTGQSKDTSVKY